jgi:hypothetical protein
MPSRAVNFSPLVFKSKSKDKISKEEKNEQENGPSFYGFVRGGVASHGLR